jgi:hypothetical protein
MAGIFVVGLAKGLQEVAQRVFQVLLVQAAQQAAHLLAITIQDDAVRQGTRRITQRTQQAEVSLSPSMMG